MHCMLFVYHVYGCVHNPNSADKCYVLCRRVIKSRDISRRLSYTDDAKFTLWLMPMTAS